MKWKTPGSEFDTVKDSIIEAYKNKIIYIYGAGMIGKRVFRALNTVTDWRVSAFVDQYKGGTKYCGLDVIGIPEMERLIAEDKGDILILMALHDEIGISVSRNLESFSKAGRKVCRTYGEFMRHDFPVLAFYEYGKTVVHSLSCIVTEKCTLRCEKCSIRLPYFQYQKKYSVESLKEEIDLAFQKIDFICDFTFTGGEPLLNQELGEILSHLGERYGDRAGTVKVITNGTIRPSASLLECMKKYGIYAEISDYTKAVESIKEQVLENYRRFQDGGIPTYLLSTAQWVDFGFERPVHPDKSEEEMAVFFDRCRTLCRGYIDGKIWYCINARFAEQALSREYDPENMLDLRELGDRPNDKLRLLEFDAGYGRRGYLTMCRYCHGGCDINTHYIEVGKQWEKPL